MSDRKESGREIAFEHPERFRRDGRLWLVKGSKGEFYEVSLESGACTCPDKTRRGEADPLHRCKHWWAVWYRAPVGATYQVRYLSPDQRGRERWIVAMVRAGVLMERLGPYYSREAAEKARGLMETGGVPVSV